MKTITKNQNFMSMKEIGKKENTFMKKEDLDLMKKLLM
jgi:hypothetical protein